MTEAAGVSRYLLPLAALSSVAAAYLLVRPRPLPARAAGPLRIAAAAPLLASGVVHILRPALYLPLIPPPFPRAVWFAGLTGIPELLGAAGLFVPRTRRAAAVCLSIYMVAIFPANVFVAGQTIGGFPMPSVPVRTAMQAAYILLLLFAGFGLPANGTFGMRRELQNP